MLNAAAHSGPDGMMSRMLVVHMELALTAPPCCADAAQPVRSKPLPTVNPNAPQLTLKDYFTVPHLKQLRVLPDAKLKVQTLIEN